MVQLKLHCGLHGIQLVGLSWDSGLCGSHKHVVQPVVRLCIRPDEDGLPTPLVKITGEALVHQVFPNVMATEYVFVSA